MSNPTEAYLPTQGPNDLRKAGILLNVCLSFSKTEHQQKPSKMDPKFHQVANVQFPACTPWDCVFISEFHKCPVLLMRMQCLRDVHFPSTAESVEVLPV